MPNKSSPALRILNPSGGLRKGCGCLVFGLLEGLRSDSASKAFEEATGCGNQGKGIKLDLPVAAQKETTGRGTW